ncbi:TIR domain-containing protein [Tenacibaculum sp. MAR_2010_89]|uniref:toll/interleukin-1 receptor domain-containing protein n=1 Tax=Tenacibaculum sp. MAR_2010_89 TaxID=1250198 RepID=UPI0008942F6E|nr:toll/interleukin-1 receptor domain-containing protein [Tenacibaculum sp. MAR_2010_89]SEE34852.1 TIR domain-containing protein [Tenacibaculum sp. MAR_2010_89]
MIFLSHNYKDKPIVEPIAIKLAKVFGMDKVFYDSWSMQPGEGIIDRMNDGLEKCEYFFFFVSKNSLQSEMVKLEWQNALYKVTQNKVKLIPVKLDDCLMPAILLQSIYVDIYGKGLEYGLRQIIDIINNENTFILKDQVYENVRASFTVKTPNEQIELEIRAESYIEPISKYILLVENEKNEIKADCTNKILMPSSNAFLENIDVTDDYKCNGLFFHISEPTTPGYAIKFTLTSKSDKPLKFVGVMRAVGDNLVRLIPTIENK